MFEILRVDCIFFLSGYSPVGRVTKSYLLGCSIRAFSDVEKPSLFSDVAALTATSENKESFSTSEIRLRLPGCLVDMKLIITAG